MNFPQTRRVGGILCLLALVVPRLHPGGRHASAEGRAAGRADHRGTGRRPAEPEGAAGRRQPVRHRRTRGVQRRRQGGRPAVHLRPRPGGDRRWALDGRRRPRGVHRGDGRRLSRRLRRQDRAVAGEAHPAILSGAFHSPSPTCRADRTTSRCCRRWRPVHPNILLWSFRADDWACDSTFVAAHNAAIEISTCASVERIRRAGNLADDALKQH